MKRNLGMTNILFTILIFSFIFILPNNNLLVYSHKDFQIIRKEINLKTASYWELFPFIIDDTGNGNYTWTQAVLEDWCSGSGTSSDPYLIENVLFDGNSWGNCLEIRESNVFFVIRNCTFIESSSIGFYTAGLYIFNVSNGQINNNTFSDNGGNGMTIYNCNNMIVTRNIARNNDHFGIYFYESNDNIITDNVAESNDPGGILLFYGNHNNVSGNLVQSNYEGLSLYYCEDTWIYENTAIYNRDGISLSNSRGNFLIGNLANLNDYGIYLQGNDPGSDVNIMRSNTASNNYYYGFYLYNSDSNEIRGNTANSNTIAGIGLYNSSHNTITENILFENRIVEEEYCDHNYLDGNYFSEFDLWWKDSQGLVYLAVGIVVIVLFYIVVSKVTKKKARLKKLEEKMISEVEKAEVPMDLSETLREKVKIEQKEVEKPVVAIELQSKILEIEELIKNMKYEDARTKLEKIREQATRYDLEEIIKLTERNLNLCNSRIIKKIVINLGMKFTRLEIIEIIEKTGIDDEELIINTITEMIENNEIYADYFSSTKVVAFNQQAIVKDIDSLMNTYKQWEVEKRSKINK